MLAIAGMLIIASQLRQQSLNDDLIEAVKKSDVQKVSMLLNSGADANVRIQESPRRDLWTMLKDMFRGKLSPANQNGRCVLSVAVGKGDSEIVKDLLNRHATGVNEETDILSPWDTKTADEVGPILIGAMRLKKTDIVLKLLDHGADIHIRDKDQETVLLNSSNLFPDTQNRIDAPQHFRKQEEFALSFIKELIRRGSNPNEMNSSREILLERSACADCSEISNYLLPLGANRDSLANALAYAVVDNNQEFAIKLLKMGVKAGQSVQDRVGPVFSAKTVPMLRLLVSYGAKLDVRIPRGNKHASYSLLHFAVMDSDLKRVHYLIEQGLDVNVDCSKGKSSPLTLASEYAETPMVELLLQNGATVNPNRNEWGSPLIAASAEGNDENIDCLLEHGADPNIRYSYNDETALMMAVENGNDEAVRNLLVGGAKVNLIDKMGHRALDFADGNKPVIRLLKKYGAKVGHGPPKSL